MAERKLLTVKYLPHLLDFSAKALQIVLTSFSEVLFLKYMTDFGAFLLRIGCSLGLPFVKEFTKKPVF